MYYCLDIPVPQWCNPPGVSHRTINFEEAGPSRVIGGPSRDTVTLVIFW